MKFSSRTHSLYDEAYSTKNDGVLFSSEYRNYSLFHFSSEDCLCDNRKTFISRLRITMRLRHNLLIFTCPTLTSTSTLNMESVNIQTFSFCVCAFTSFLSPISNIEISFNPFSFLYSQSFNLSSSFRYSCQLANISCRFAHLGWKSRFYYKIDTSIEVLTGCKPTGTR